MSNSVPVPVRAIPPRPLDAVEPLEELIPGSVQGELRRSTLTASTVVVKLGGAQVDDPTWLAEFAAAAARVAVSSPLCIVHGGGRDITALLEQLGLRSSWVDGRRVTSEAQLEGVRMALSGTVNKRIVAVLRGAGVNAVGISGEDGVLEARLADGGSLGRVGIPARVGVQLLEAMIEAGCVPVVSPVSRGPDGGGLNVNADEAAAAIAGALHAEALIFVSDVPGVLRDGRALDRVTPRTLEYLLASGAAHSGMLPKLVSAAHAAKCVADVRIGDLGSLLDATRGSRVLPRLLGDATDHGTRVEEPREPRLVEEIDEERG